MCSSDLIGWLRAAVLGANDGLISTGSLIVGVASASPDRSAVLLAGVAGLVAGALSMAAGEYVSVCSQADTENADLAMAARVGDTDIWGRPVDPALAGLYGFPMSPTRTSMHRFDPETGEQHEMAWSGNEGNLFSRQLSAFDWSFEGWNTPEAFHSVYHGFRPEAIVQRMLDVYRDRVDRSLLPTEETPAAVRTHSWDGLRQVSEYCYDDLGDLPSSPIFVPVAPGTDGRSAHGGTRPGGLHGWVVVPVLSDAGFRYSHHIDLVDGGPVLEVHLDPWCR